MNFEQQIVNGLVLGHAYALVAIGWTVLLGVARLVNFGHGQMYMLGAFTTWWVMARFGLPYVFAVPISMIVGVAIGYLMQRVMLQLTIKQDLVSIMIVTLGFGHVLGGAASLLFGSTGQILSTPLSSQNVYLGNLWFSYQDVAIVVVAVVVFVALEFAMKRTRAGRLARMVAEDPKLAQLAGVDVKKVYLGIFAFEGAAVALAAALVAPRTPILTSMGFDQVIITFVVVVLGGIGSIAGSYVAGVALGLFTAFFGAYVSAAYTTAAAFVVLIAFLVVRPGGLASSAGGILMPAANLVVAVALAVAGFFLPWLLGGGGAIFSALVLIAIFAVMSYGLDIIVSDLGEVSLAHTVFFAAGAYATALASAEAGLGPFASLLITIAVCLAIAAGLGLITLRLRHFVFSLVTYAVNVVAMTLASNWSFLGGSDGLSGIPLFSVGLGGARYTATGDAGLWPVAYLLLVATIYLTNAFRRSRLGRAAMAVHLNSRLAIMSGVDPQRVRVQVFMVSAPITASAGWLYAYQRAYIGADVLDAYFLILMLTAVVLVGRRLLLAPLAGVALILAQEKFLSFGAYVDEIILGGALIVTLSFLPRGLAGLGFDLVKRVRRPAARLSNKAL